MKFKTDGAYRGNLALPERFVREDLKTLSEAETKLYLLCVMYMHNGKQAEFTDLAELSGFSMRECVEALQGLDGKGLVRLTTTSVTLLGTDAEAHVITKNPFKVTADMIAQSDDPIEQELHAYADKVFGKMHSEEDVTTLWSLYRTLEIPAGVLMVAMEYLAAANKRSMKYLKKTALSWHEQGIDTVQAAHQHITYLEAQKEYYALMRETLGIFGREFTKQEKKYLDEWKESYTPDQIKEAYDITVDSTGKISFPYTNKVLKSDGKPEFKKPTPKKRVTPSKFNNFEGREKDYDSMKEKARQRAKALAEKL